MQIDPSTLPYDPDRHDTQLVAAFARLQQAEAARSALLGAGLPVHIIELIGNTSEVQSEGFWDAVRNLFAPHDDAREIGQAIGRGHVMVVVHPENASDRETAIEVLEGCGPVDFEERAESAPVALNHAETTRADLLAEAATHPRPVEPVPEVKPEPAAATGTTYTYGIPESVAQAMTPEQIITAQSDPEAQSRPPFVRIVEERLRVGWRDRSGRATPVRSYVADREAAKQRVQLLEEDIAQPSEQPADRPKPN